jgi:hypothetical protein
LLRPEDHAKQKALKEKLRGLTRVHSWRAQRIGIEGTAEDNGLSDSDRSDWREGATGLASAVPESSPVRAERWPGFAGL